MTFDKFTIKAQETVQEAVNLAQRSGQQSIEPVHLLKAIMTKARDVAGFIFQKLGVNAQQVETLVDSEISHLPRVQGGQPYLSGDTNNILQHAEDMSQKMGDQFVSVEPILLAIVAASTTASRILKDAGGTEKEMRKATRLKVDRKPSGERKPREREADTVKREIVAKVAEAMSQYENVEIANVEREVTFVIDGAEYSLTLTKHRKSKK